MSDSTIVFPNRGNDQYINDMQTALSHCGYEVIWNIDGIFGLAQLVANFRENGDRPWLDRITAMEVWLNENPHFFFKSWLRKVE